MIIVKTHKKGQIVVPKAIRDKLGIRPGSLVGISLVGDHAELRPLPENPIEYLTGIFEGRGGSMAGELLQERNRDDRTDEATTL